MSMHTIYLIIIGLLIFIFFKTLKSRDSYKKLNTIKSEDIINYKRELTFYNIETAPKDRLILLGFDSYDCGWTVDLAQWHKVTNPETPDGYDEGFWAVYTPDGKIHKLDYPYTHWMLPAGMYHKILIKES